MRVTVDQARHEHSTVTFHYFIFRSGDHVGANGDNFAIALPQASDPDRRGSQFDKHSVLEKGSHQSRSKTPVC